MLIVAVIAVTTSTVTRAIIAGIIITITLITTADITDI